MQAIKMINQIPIAAAGSSWAASGIHDTPEAVTYGFPLVLPMVPPP